jgi:hypothetical protein
MPNKMKYFKFNLWNYNKKKIKPNFPAEVAENKADGE